MESLSDGSKQSNKSYSINISHRQDAKAHPYRNIGGSINIQTNRYDQRVYENPRAALIGTYSSNFSFSHDMPGTPFRFNAELRHSQNTQTRVMDITLPRAALSFLAIIRSIPACCRNLRLNGSETVSALGLTKPARRRKRDQEPHGVPVGSRRECTEWQAIRN